MKLNTLHIRDTFFHPTSHAQKDSSDDTTKGHSRGLEDLVSNTMAVLKRAQSAATAVAVSPIGHSYSKKTKENHVPPQSSNSDPAKQPSDDLKKSTQTTRRPPTSVTSSFVVSFKESAQKDMPCRLYRKVSVGSTEEGQAEIWMDSFTRSESESESDSMLEFPSYKQQQQQEYSIKLLRGNGLKGQQQNAIGSQPNQPLAKVASVSVDYLDHHSQQWRTIIHVPVESDDTIWGGPLYTFQMQASPKDILVFCLLDAQKEEVALTELSIEEHLQSQQHGIVNQWLTLTVPDSNGNEPQIQIQLTPNTSTAILHPQETCPILGPGPALPSMMTSYVARKEILFAHAPVILNVYDVSLSDHISTLNNYLKPLGAGGIFHAAIQVHGKEFSFGGTRDKNQKGTGVFACAPKQCPIHHYKESIYLGDCKLTKPQVQAIVQGLEPKWLAKDYNLFRKNCCFFSQEFAIELGVGDIPPWVYSLAQNTQGMEPHLMKLNNYIMEYQKKQRQRQNEYEHNQAEKGESCAKKTSNSPMAAATNIPKSKPNETRQEEATDVMLDHVMAARIQRGFRSSVRCPQPSVKPARS